MRLYKKLSKAEQDEIYSKCLQFLRRPERSEFDLCLKEIGDAFNVLRYKYEYRGMVIEARFILGFTFALKEKMEQQSN